MRAHSFIGLLISPPPALNSAPPTSGMLSLALFLSLRAESIAKNLVYQFILIVLLIMNYHFS
jgi:hypothetical protein